MGNCVVGGAVGFRVVGSSVSDCDSVVIVGDCVDAGCRCSCRCSCRRSCRSLRCVGRGWCLGRRFWSYARGVTSCAGGSSGRELAGAVERWAGGTGSDSSVLRKAAAKARAAGIQANSLLSKYYEQSSVSRSPTKSLENPWGRKALRRRQGELAK